MYKINFPHQNNIILNPNKSSVQGIYPIRLKSSDDKVVCIRHERSISGYKFISQNSSWVYLWNETVFEKEENYPLDEYPWLITDTILPDEDVIILKHPEGIRFYVPDLEKPGLKLLKEDGHFHDVYGYKVLWGRFYPDSNELGVMTRKETGEVKFFVISNDSLWPNTIYPVFPASIDVSKTTNWNSDNSELMLSNVMQEQAIFVLRTSSGLEMYKFNDDYILDPILYISDLRKVDKTILDHIYFANLTKQPYLDLLHFNTSGMHVYQYNSKENTYIVIHKSAAEEIRKCIESIKIADLNNDGKDELIFTGYHGLKALTFDTNNKWKTLLNADQLPGAQKYSNVVGVLPSLPSKISPSSLFMQDLKGNIQWVNIIPDDKPKAAAFHYSTDVPLNAVLSYNEIPERPNIVYPKQISRSTLSEKPTLRWSEQWDVSFLMKAVDAGSGHVRFSVPLVDLSTSTGWNLKLALLYNSDETTANQLGSGWSMSINPDYIYVDHQGSIYPEDAQYYVMIQGQLQLLELISTNGDTRTYQVAKYSDDSITVIYNMSEETWVIENEAEQTVYGKAKHPLAEDILQWSLEWPNWRGPGTNKEQQQPVVQAWFINSRLDKAKNNLLYYYYDTEKSSLHNGKSYTSVIRLKAIKANQLSKIIFTYASKLNAEYTKMEPINANGNIMFPVSLLEKYYLQDIRITTSFYQQTFLLRYEVKNEKRLLKSIHQEIDSNAESLLQFDYKSFLDEQVLVSCKTPRLSVNFDYKLITPSFPSLGEQYNRIPEKPKISYGPDYAIVAYRNITNKKIIFRIMSRDMVKSDVEITLDIVPAYLSIEDFQLFSYNNSFSVLLSTNENRILYFYTRKNKEWSIQNKIFYFNKKTFPYFGESIIVFWEKDTKILKIIEYNETKLTWTESSVTLPSPIKYFALHNKLITGYDDNNLWLFHKDEKSNWQKRNLKSNLGRPDKIVDCFDIDEETKDQWMQGIKQSSLQVYNNLIVLSSMQELNERIYSHIHVFHLDRKFNLVKYRYFVEERESIKNLSEHFKYESSTYTLKYFKENGRQKLKIIALSGEIVKDVNGIRNRNRRQDAMEERIKLINESEGWRTFLKKKMLINWNLYRTQLNYQGITCGNDILFRFTGTDWTKEKLKPSEQIQPLGKYFVLESISRDKIALKLYKQDKNKQKQGQALIQIDVTESGAFVNKYPYYIAYQKTPNEIVVVTFKNQKTLDKTYSFKNEELLSESDWKNILILRNASTSFELKTIPTSTFISPEKRLFVERFTISGDNEKRITGYDRIYNQKLKSFAETTKIILGDNISVSGWIELTLSYDLKTGNVTKTENNFDSNGKLVLNPSENDMSENESNNNKGLAEKNPMILYDRNGNLQICNFSPYTLSSDMVDYYGFESYEVDHINTIIANQNSTTQVWNSKGAKIIKQGFTFTGDHYLEIKSSQDDPGFIEKVFKPYNQDIIYMAACWIRCKTPLDLFSPINYLKATIKTTEGQKIITLLGQVKQQHGEWYYLELPIDFQIVNQVYEEYVAHMLKTTSNSTGTALPQINAVQYTITLRVESMVNENIDVDHIRFAPMGFEFEASVYDSMMKKQTAVIQADGSVTRTFYNRFQEEIASLREDGQIDQITTSSKCGFMLSSINNIISNQNPSQVTFEPISGFYETFDTFALRSRWKLENPAAWNVAPGQLWHKVSRKNRLEADPRLFDKASAAIRFNFAMESSQATLVLIWQEIGYIKIIRDNKSSSLILPNNESINYLPTNGEIIVMLDGNYIWLWLNGVLLIDQLLKSEEIIVNPWSLFVLEFYGQVLVEDLFIMNRPYVQVEYFNSFGDKTLVIQLENAQSALVSESLYDEIGREAIKTKTTRIKRQGTSPLLKEQLNFVTNKNHTSQYSVWRTGKLQGKVDQLNVLDHGFAYRRTEFERNPLNEEKTLGLPGSDFAITGKYATKKSQDSGIPFLSNLFPSKQGFRQKVIDAPNGTKKVSVFDKYKNQIAQYIRVPGYNHLISTYEYDSENRLMKILPPLYHEKVNTDIRLKPWQAGEEHLTKQEKEWQRLLATKFIYNENGNLIRKITPDTGTTEYLYNSVGQMRFMVALNSNHSIEQIVYYDYDSQGQLIRSGHISKPLPLTTLRDHLESQDLPYSEDYQLFDYSDNHLNPIKRGRVKNFITFNFNGPVIEKVQFNNQQQIEQKEMILDRSDSDKFTKIKKDYMGKKLSILTYPPLENDQQLKLFHRYNQLGQLMSIGTANDSLFIHFTYDANGQIESEHHHLNNFTRNYRYNSPGFLQELSDPFLTEHLSYTDNGYGHEGYGDGMIMQTTFNATWPTNADGRWFQLKQQEIGALCLRALKRTGHISKNNQPLRLFLREMETRIPLECGGNIGNHIAKLIAERMMPQYYGHRYAYGNHQELVKAKYFSDETTKFIGPLQPDTFAKLIPAINREQSFHIWKLLNDNNFITTDNQRNDPNVAVGLRENSIFRDQNLKDDLKKLNENFILYVEPIKQLILKSIAQRQSLTEAEFEDIFLSWEGIDQISNIMETNLKRSNAKVIGTMLLEEGYFGTNTTSVSRALDQKFTSTLKEYADYIPEIIQVLQVQFAHAVGTTAFDVESYKIDANGNHRLFWTGFNRYEFSYENNTNKIENVILKTFDQENLFSSNENLPMKHDALGNVIHASHKGIENIEYHPVSQRTTLIKLTDGRIIRFFYDAQGERALKQVFLSNGHLSYERQYLRDEKGRVLADRVINYLSGETTQVVTGYLYGPRGLLGFIRNKKFYSVTTDHIGSVRLVISDGQVVAAYDYLPYGQLMRSYGNDPDAQIVYRYTGQEWDEETNLYNFHARLFDPNIGRFYQPDPKSQYFSPYKYAGNSPVALIDPDGEFAFIFLFAAIFAIGGAYLGGAAANNRWNPKDWDFSDPGTYLGIGGGALAGFFLPIGAVASAGTIGIGATVLLGTGGSYLMTAAANQNWNPAKWKWDRPGTWNAMFQGFGAGSGLAGGVGMAHHFAGKVFAGNKLGKILFLGASYTAGVGMTYGAGVMANDGQFAFWKWDWTNPSTWASLVDGFDTGMGWPQGFLEVGRGLSKLAKNPKLLRSLLGKNASKWKKMKAILKNPEHPLYKVTGGLVMTYFMGSSANGEFDVTRWNLASFSTYEGVINGVFSGKDTISMIKYARQTKIKLPKLKLNKLKKFKNLQYNKNIIKQLDNMQLSRKKMEYARLIETFFSDGSKYKSKLIKNTKSVNGKKEIENFFKRGEKKWKKGESKTPKELDKLLIKEIDDNVLSSSKDLIEWRQTSDELNHKQNEIFPDNDAEFLSCRRFGKRRRGVKRSGCILPENNKETEVLEEYFHFNVDVESKSFVRIDPITKKYSHNYKDKLSLILNRTPNILLGSKPNFLPDFVIGSLLTNHQSGLMHTQKDVFIKKDNMKFSNSLNRQFDHSVLKTSFKTDIDGQTWLVLKSYVVEPEFITKQTKKEAESFRDKFLKQLDTKFKYDKLEIDSLVKKLDIKGEYSIKEEIYYLDQENKLYTNEKKSAYSDYDHNSENIINTEFKKVESLLDMNLENHLNKLSNENIRVVKEGIKDLSKDLLEVFNKNKEILQLDKHVAESRFHAFLYGALSMNFQKRYNLDVYVERVAGRGYADMFLLSRKDNRKNKNWNAIPIVIELKSDGTSSKGAVDQAVGSGYLNNLSLRTVAEKALIVGINSKTSEINIQEALIPANKNIIKASLDHLGKKEIIENELQNMYNSIAPAAIKTPSSENDHYLSRLLIGELIGTHSTKQFVKYHVDGDFKDKLTSYLYKDTNSNEWIMLNVVENSVKQNTDYIFKDVPLNKLKLEIPPGLDIKDFTRIDIKLNNRSKAGWTPEQPKRTYGDASSSLQTNKNKYCLQDIKIEKFHVNDDNAIKPGKFSYEEMVPIDVNKIFNMESKLKFSELTVELFENADFQNNLKNLKTFINSESDFQSVLQGLLMSNLQVSDGSIIKVFPEVNPSAAGRIDLVVSKLRKINGQVFEEHLIIMELKYAKKTEDVELKLKEAHEQVMKYKNNLSSFTDLKVYTPLAVVYNKETGTIFCKAKPASEVVHYSDSDSDIDIISDTKKLKLNKRSLRNDQANNSEECRVTDKSTSETYTIARASSGSSRIQFWPINLIHKAQSTILSIITALWISAPAEKPVHNLNEEYWTKQRATYETSNPTPSILEMGDKWLQSTDLNSNLTLGILIARKLTGYRPKPPKYESYDNDIEIGLRATELVNSFMEMITVEYEDTGLNNLDYDIFDNSTTYSEAIQLVHRKLTTGEIYKIPQQLYVQIVEKNIKHYCFLSSKIIIDNFVSNVKKSLNMWAFQNLYLEDEKLASTKRAFDNCQYAVQNNVYSENVSNLSLINEINSINNDNLLK